MMKPKRLLWLALVLSSGLLGCSTVTRSRGDDQSPKVADMAKVKLKVVKVGSDETNSQDCYGANAVDGNLNPLCAGAVEDHSSAQPAPDAIVEQMRCFSMQLSQTRRSDGKIVPEQQRKIEIRRQLRLIRKAAVPALVKALKDPEVQMRRNSALVLISLAGAYADEQPRPEKSGYSGGHTRVSPSN